VALFGVALHAIVKEAARATPALSELFSKAGIKGFAIEKIRPSLEDVFVSLIERYDRQEGVCEPKES
jgi:ABC-2 type transport system ATP-binding protein